MSQFTTHILDTSLGKPAQGVTIKLEKPNDTGGWTVIGSGETNADGRIPGLVSENMVLQPGTYRMVFFTASYFDAMGIKAFYPIVAIEFETFDTSHYHIPLLLNPFGYSTYRGS